jgi:hypothetical protein
MSTLVCCELSRAKQILARDVGLRWDLQSGLAHAPARLADSTSWISCFATTRWSAVTLDPGKRQMNILLLVDTTIGGASPSHARQE